MSSNAASSAADTQADAAKQASQVQQQQFQQIQQNLAPYMAAGQTGLSSLLGMLGLSTPGVTQPAGPTEAQLYQQLLPQFTTTTQSNGDDSGGHWVQTGRGGDDGYGQEWVPNSPGSGSTGSSSTIDTAGLSAAIQAALSKQGLQSSQPTQLPPGLAALGQQLTTPFSFNASNLDQTPGYQFTLQQGLKAMNNQNSAQGLGQSGAQQKGLLQYATGLADNTYGNQYNRALQQYQTNYGISNDMYNRLSGLAGLGQSAAAGVGNMGLQTASNISGLITGAGNAQAAGQVGSANALTSGLSGLGSNGLLYSLLGNQGSSGSIYGSPAYNNFVTNANQGGFGSAFTNMTDPAYG